MNLDKHTALVTGATGGLGRAFAKILASLGANLIITGRRKDRLEKLAEELSSTYSVQVMIIPLDLTKRGSCEKLLQKVDESEQSIDILINNAGIGTFSRFIDTPWDRISQEIKLNISATTELTWNISRKMRERDSGYILNVSSVTGYIPTPGYATYAATKAYIRIFTEAAAYELRDTRVSLMSLCPGAIASEFWTSAGHTKLPSILKASMANPEKVAWASITALFCGRTTLVTGFSSKLAVFLVRFLPSRFMAWICTKILKQS